MCWSTYHRCTKCEFLLPDLFPNLKQSSNADFLVFNKSLSWNHMANGTLTILEEGMTTWSLYHIITFFYYILIENNHVSGPFNIKFFGSLPSLQLKKKRISCLFPYMFISIKMQYEKYKLKCYKWKRNHYL